MARWASAAVLSGSAFLGLLFVAGVLAPAPEYFPRDDGRELHALLVLVLMPLALLLAFVVESHAAREGSQWRMALALGVFHAAMTEAWFTRFWSAFDYARVFFGSPTQRAGVLLLCLLTARLALGAADLARGGYVWWRVYGRGVLVGPVLAMGLGVFPVVLEEPGLEIIAVLPLMAMFAVPLGFIFGLALGALDLALAALARLLPRAYRGSASPEMD